VANEKPLSDRQQAFVAHYLVSRNASDAYRKAGYAAKDANVAGPRLLANVRIAAEIAKGEAKTLEKLSLTADDIVAKLELIATADPAKLTAHHIGACRYCWGIEHHYQWRTPREFSEAVELHMLKGEAYAANHPPPEMEGGYGYRQTRRPNPECPECDGLGRPHVIFADTRDMDPAERELFLGVKQTQHGIEYKMADKAHALDQLAQRTGVFAKRDENFANALVQAVAEIQNRTSRAPINRPKPPEGEPG
jgi:hypothetical protein